MSYWKDLDISLDKKNNGDINDFVNIDAVKKSIENILKTLQGSRRMLPTFALNMYDYIFDPIDDVTAYDIGERILEVISDWDDRVIVEDILVKPNEDNNRYDISLVFKINESSEERREIKTIITTA